MCDHRLTYHSEHGTNMIVYCTRCNAQWSAPTGVAQNFVFGPGADSLKIRN